MWFKKLTFLAATLIPVCLVSGALYGATLRDDIEHATHILEDFRKIPEKTVPAEVMQQAKGLALVTLTKGGAIVSGHGGTGVVVARHGREWSAPSAIGVGGAGLGLQLGAEVSDLLIVINTQEALDAFSKGGNLSLGGILSLAAGPVGKTIKGQILPSAAIYTYSRNRGLYAGISLEGTVVAERKDANAEFYGKPVTAEELLKGKISRPRHIDSFYQQLNKLSCESCWGS